MPYLASIPEAPIAHFTHVLQTGYARSKLVGEHIVCNAAVDTLATAILELPGTPTTSSTPLGSGIRDPSIFYNLVNPHVFSWEDFLSELHAGGLELSPVSFNNWRQMLQKSAAQGEEIHNPAVKLIEYFEKSYGVVEGFERKDITFETTAAQRDSAVLRSAPKMIDAGHVRMVLASWLQRWN